MIWGFTSFYDFSSPIFIIDCSFLLSLYSTLNCLQVWNLLYKWTCLASPLLSFIPWRDSSYSSMQVLPCNLMPELPLTDHTRKLISQAVCESAVIRTGWSEPAVTRLGCHKLAHTVSEEVWLNFQLSEWAVLSLQISDCCEFGNSIQSQEN